MLRVSWRHVQKSRASMRHASTLQVCDSIESYRKVRGSIAPGATVGFGLHAGHLSLIQEARKRCDVVVASVFVNPAQFGPNEDFEKYPRTLEADLALLRQENVDIVFTPARDSMYSSSFRTYVDPEGFNDVPEGQCRPGFFRGVATIVAKLFNIVAPTHAFFGQKDAVQCVVIKRVIADLNFPIELHVLDTCREPSGLAMSTRNQYLTPQERQASAVIFAGLKQAADVFAAATAATVPASVLRATIEKVYKSEPRLQSIQYISIASKETMDELDDVSKDQGAIISVAVKVGQCRLIDNIVL
ncbi:hypothetical protein DYB26_013813 [Aphanomyces astaci]|uniref:Pantoate--beta-alanine ligase n=1 Tax=Aphanomyces astaci TaxID=112090 RepID=A0A418DVF3_APHAT|nr:hypothetical protein DYB26_013813 [Aphanomyces astaci]